MTDSYFQRVKAGATAMVSGMSHMWRDKEVRRAYRFILLALFLFSLVLNTAGIYGVVHLTDPSPEASGWVSAGLMVLRALGILVVLLLSPIVAITSCNLLFPVFAEIPFFAGLRSLDAARAALLEAQEGLGNAAAILNSLRRFSVFLCVIAGCFLLGLIPVIGPFIATPLQFYLASRTLGWEMLDPYFDKICVRWDDQKKVVRRFGPEILGMGLVCTPLLAIPLIGPLFFGLLQASAAQFVVSVLPPGDQPSDLLPSDS